MSPTEKTEFVRELLKTCRMAGKDISADPTLIADWLEEFDRYPVTALIAALQKHRQKSPHSPKPADVYGYLDGAKADDGRPSGNEAWGLLIGVIHDERLTGVLSDEMREAWGICQPILDLGDEVGARMAFLAAYEREVSQARQQRRPARWTVTLGTDPASRSGALQAAVNARRISCDYARALLPGVPIASLNQVAGLLEGPTSPKSDVETAARLRALAAMIRSSSAAAEQQRNEERARARAAEAEQKRRIEAMLDAHIAPDGQEAA